MKTSFIKGNSREISFGIFLRSGGPWTVGLYAIFMPSRNKENSEEFSLIYIRSNIIFYTWDLPECVGVRSHCIHITRLAGCQLSLIWLSYQFSLARIFAYCILNTRFIIIRGCILSFEVINSNGTIGIWRSFFFNETVLSLFFPAHDKWLSSLVTDRMKNE